MKRTLSYLMSKQQGQDVKLLLYQHSLNEHQHITKLSINVILGVALFNTRVFHSANILDCKKISCLLRVHFPVHFCYLFYCHLDHV